MKHNTQIIGPRKLKILTCLKQVPDMESAFRIADSGIGFDERGLVFRTNTYDEFALEEAAQIKETSVDVEITVLSVGPARAAAVVRRGIEFGADIGVHILTEESRRLDPLEIASYISCYAKEHSFDLFIFGVISEDEQRGQVGPMTAALIGIPCAAIVIAEKLSLDLKSVVVQRELEGGNREVIEMQLPAAITVQSGVNTPRYPSLTNKLRARKQQLITIDSSNMTIPRKSQRIVKSYLPAPVSGVFIEGTIEEQADKLVRIIHEKTDAL